MRSFIEALVTVTDRTYHHFAPPGTDVPYVVWAETGRNDLLAGNTHAERAWVGTVDLFTATEAEPMVCDLENAFEAVNVAYSLISVDYEEETGLIHYSWDWEMAYGNH